MAKTLTVQLVHSPKPLLKRTRHQPWRWKAVAANGRVVAISGESYTNRQDCLDAISLVFGGETSVRLAVKSCGLEFLR